MLKACSCEGAKGPAGEQGPQGPPGTVVDSLALSSGIANWTSATPFNASQNLLELPAGVAGTLYRPASLVNAAFTTNNPSLFSYESGILTVLSDANIQITYNVSLVGVINGGVILSNQRNLVVDTDGTYSRMGPPFGITNVGIEFLSIQSVSAGDTFQPVLRFDDDILDNAMSLIFVSIIVSTVR